mgnify:CR=1 FL=1
MAQTFMPTDLADFMPTSRSSNTVQSAGAAPRRLGGEQVDVGLVLADVVRVIDGDDIVEQIEHADVA